jgi:predicted permease
VTRVREMAVRRALGASTKTLIAQLFTESMLLGIAGSIVGIALAIGGVRAFLVMMPRGLPRAGTIGVDLRVFLFAAAVGLATAVVFGLLPALRFARSRIADPMRTSSRSVTGGRASHMVRSGIIVTEVALSLVLVAQAGWLLRSFIRINAQELGFNSAGVITMPMSVAGIDSAAVWNVRMEAVRQSVAQVSGVRDVAFGLTMPLEFTGGSRCCWSQRPMFAGKERPQQSTAYHPVTDNYFRMLGIHIVAGQDWTEVRARAVPGPVVINEALAKAMFGTTNAAIGAVLTISNKPYEVVGVAANNRHYGADQPYGTALYLPVADIPFSPGRVMIAVKTHRTDDKLAAELRAAIWRTEPNLPVPTIRALDDWASAATARRRFDSLLFGTFSVIALLLVAGGLAGTLWYSVNLQRRSLGIRLALGATPRRLERGVLTNGVGMAAIGAVLGGVGAWFAGKLIESRLFGVDARDTRTLALSIGVLMLMALISSWVPARRAAVTNPMESLRTE